VTERPVFCVFGLGDAGARIAGDLAAAGVDVRGYDPAEVATPAGVVRHHEPGPAAAGAGVVLAVTAATDAATALTQSLDVIAPDAVYADLATAPPALKRRLGTIAREAGLGFADVALMAVVAGTGLRTPALASGPAARDFVAAMAPLGMPVEHAGDEPGGAATRKLLRSVFMKGLAAVVIESMRAADAADLAGETWANIVGQITAADEELLRRLVTGTPRHAARRVHEMEAAAALLSELGVEPTMTDATTAHLRRVEADPALVPDLPRTL
jgi:3-hydroxyisobutyrate dehydrogenase-like beta-hydroxyacid dehydrogenase